MTTSSIGKQQSVHSAQSVHTAQSVQGASEARTTPPLTILNTPNPLRPLSIQTTIQQGKYFSSKVNKNQ